MATLLEVIQATIDFLESSNGLGIRCIKGEPDFRRPKLSPPVSAVLYAGSSETGQAVATARRIGSGLNAIAIALQIYATDEINLFELAEILGGLRRRKNIKLTAGADNDIRLAFGGDERIPADPDDQKELRHAIACPVVISYE